VAGGHDFRRLPTGARVTGRPPVSEDGPWKSLRAPARRPIPAGEPAGDQAGPIG